MVNKLFRVSLHDDAYYTAQADENLLSAAQRARWLVRYGCRNGNCEACVASLCEGRVQPIKDFGHFCAGNIIEAPADKILLCLCQPLSDLSITLPNDPRPGSLDQSLRSYARLHRQTVIAGEKPVTTVEKTITTIETTITTIENAAEATESVLYFALPAGRQPELFRDQIALIETDSGLLQGRIDHEQSHGRELVVRMSFASPLQEGTYYHVRYPLSQPPTGALR